MASELRMVLYVYAETNVFVGSVGQIGMLEMDRAYANATYAAFQNNADNQLPPGVYGIVSNAPVELRLPAGGSDKVIVRSEPMRKDPWPDPPPPPPRVFGTPSNWAEHLRVFMVPLGGSFEAPRLRTQWADGKETIL